MKTQPPLSRALAGEVLGAYLLVLFGTGSVAAAVLTSAQMGLWQVAVMWGFGMTIAIYASAALSGAHLNPAVSLAFALWRRQDFPPERLLPYIVAQLLRAVLAGVGAAWIRAICNRTHAAACWPTGQHETATGLRRR
jgi:glycerol uptake facilitator protein